MGLEMDHYYLYLLGDDGHIKAREILSVHDEGEALTKADAYLHAHTSVPAVKLWLGERRIKALTQTAAADAIRVDTAASLSAEKNRSNLPTE
jgi:hypothetical protein